MTDGSSRRLDAEFYDRPVLVVARDLLGCVVRCGDVAVRLTEVEAYDGARDPGSHAYRGQTARNAVMFGPPGGLYVYFTYGMHHCANLVCGPRGEASAVLLRAGEVVDGAEVAQARRAARLTLGPDGAPRRIAPRDLARGPARLVTALGIAPTDNGLLTTEPGALVNVVAGEPTVEDAVCTGPRVGVAGPGGDGAAYPWRFWLAGEDSVSVYRPASRRPRPRRG